MSSLDEIVNKGLRDAEAKLREAYEGALRKLKEIRDGGLADIRRRLEEASERFAKEVSG